MQLSKESIKNILNLVLRKTERISDKEYQKRVWIRGEGPEVDDFDETCNYFFDTGRPILEDYKTYGLSATQYHILKKFSDELDIFCDEHSSWPPFFIDTPEWAKIMKRAKEVLEVFNYQKHDENNT